MAKIVFSDVDGTLLNDKKRMTALTVQEVKKLKEKGIPFVIVSSRSPAGIYPILKRNDFNCMITAFGGGLILDEERKPLYHRGMPKETAGQIIEYIEEKQYPLSWNLFSMDQWIVKDKKDPRIRNEEFLVEAESEQGTIDSITLDEVNKILCICEEDTIDMVESDLRKQFPMVDVVKSASYLLEVMPKGITKADAVHFICQYLDIDVKNAVAFGDNYNDVEMLETVGTAYLMANAPEELKKKFLNHTQNDNNHDGMYEALSKL